ncbi:hydroxymethylglutaryl-CoA synthase [Catellatospora coxensis]
MRGDGAHFVDSFDALAMHTPFPGMVKGAHRTVVRRRGWLAPAAIEEDFDRRVAASLRYPRMVGNIYSGSTLLAVASAIAHTAPEQERLGVFSYGGGCASEFFALRVQPGGHAAVAQAGIDQALEQRRRLTIAEYDTILDALPQVACGVQDAAPDLDRFRHAIDAASATRPIALLSAIKGYHRGYTWMKEASRGCRNRSCDGAPRTRPRAGGADAARRGQHADAGPHREPVRGAGRSGTHTGLPPVRPDRRGRLLLRRARSRRRRPGPALG